MSKARGDSVNEWKVSLLLLGILLAGLTIVGAYFAWRVWT